MKRLGEISIMNAAVEKLKLLAPENKRQQLAQSSREKVVCNDFLQIETQHMEQNHHQMILPIYQRGAREAHSELH